MRTPAAPQDPLQTPLNAILGTEGNVRILRSLSATDIPHSVREIARQVQLTVAAVARACERLEDLGVVEQVGRSRSALYRLSSRWGLAHAIRTLFNLERARASEVTERVRQLLIEPDDRILSAWVEPPIGDARTPADPSIAVGALVASPDVDSVREKLWARLIDVQRDYDVTVTLRVQTKADLLTASEERQKTLSQSQPVKGWGPASVQAQAAIMEAAVKPTVERTHAYRDDEQRRIAAGIATLMKADPTLVERSRAYLKSRLLVASPGEALELREWADILASRSDARIRRLLTACDERMTRLRQSMPFLAVLTETERASLRDTPRGR